MHQRLLVSEYAATKQLVCSQLVAALNIYTSNGVIVCIEDGKIPLFKGRDDGEILYISGVALRLSKSQNSKAMELADGIAAHLLATSSDFFNVQIVPPGWIHLKLTHSTLAVWLQNLAVGSATLEKVQGREASLIQNPSRLFAIQYAHARCRSLVLLAQREGLIKLSGSVTDGSLAISDVIAQQPIPWLNCDQRLRLNHPDEAHLIAELVQVVDDWECSDGSGSVNWEKAALNLSQAFETFWCNCRIWGEVKISSPELAQARLGLLMATQFVLRSLLEEKLGVFALLEL
ncbi:DALR anticodon-binding domain-containing protein [Cylindrospermum sp. FACHB-282]|uniref:DALR anticodon-binding domain-containing protein n=1 Tax=Cylindrospermum sp. FACHB-282 TaxID=2692794 RepID=UPI001688AE85|nr:DALR anticodon-binding domain-containing protein [Cylindrospermum sp. FACHB-282]MBD2386808.1 glutamate acetyltransferase [Cylindrospermum sp. FACHB-282]